MVAFAAVAKSLKNPNLQNTITHLFRFQKARTFLVQSTSESIKLQKLTDSDSGIWEVNLERHSMKNAIGRDMLRGLQHTLESVNRDETAKVLMICSSVPKIFCAGADLKERKTMSPSEVHDFVHSLRSTFSYLEALCIPTIAVIEGIALGGGLEMALSCDLRICGENALLGLPETGLAIIPGAGGTQRLPRLVGKSIAKELIFTGRKVDARDALSMGLVNYCVPDGEARLKALEIARDINHKGPLAIRMAKRAIDGGLEVDMESGLALEEECYEELLHTKDRLEGLAAFAERRKPIYTGKVSQNASWMQCKSCGRGVTYNAQTKNSATQQLLHCVGQLLTKSLELRKSPTLLLTHWSPYSRKCLCHLSVPLSLSECDCR